MIDTLRRTTAWGVVAVLFLAAGQAVIAADGPDRFRTADRLLGPAADWVATDGSGVAFGTGGRVYIADGGPALILRSYIELDASVSDGAFIGHLLFLADETQGLLLLDLSGASPKPRPIEMDIPVSGEIHRTLFHSRRDGLAIRCLQNVGVSSDFDYQDYQ